MNNGSSAYSHSNSSTTKNRSNSVWKYLTIHAQNIYVANTDMYLLTLKVISSYRYIVYKYWQCPQWWQKAPAFNEGIIVLLKRKTCSFLGWVQTTEIAFIWQSDNADRAVHDVQGATIKSVDKKSTLSSV